MFGVSVLGFRAMVVVVLFVGWCALGVAVDKDKPLKAELSWASLLDAKLFGAE